MKIITLTLNPAFDVHCECNNFKPYHESIAKITSKEAGGKGVNISRALTENGVENQAIVIVGTENGDEFCKALQNDGLSVFSVWAKGRIRENITLHEQVNPETRISFEGFCCDGCILTEIEKQIANADNQTVITFTGSIPKGIRIEDVLSLLNKARNKGAKIVIDSRSVSFEQLIDFKPWLIKPNKDEAQLYTGLKINSVNDAVVIAKNLNEKGVENVIISLGRDGAVLANDGGEYIATTPDLPILSTIGAGDSMLAGFIDGAAKGLNVENVLKRAVAFGTAACLQEGTKPPKKQDVIDVEKQVAVRKI